MTKEVKSVGNETAPTKIVEILKNWISGSMQEKEKKLCCSSTFSNSDILLHDLARIAKIWARALVRERERVCVCVCVCVCMSERERCRVSVIV